MSQLSMMTKKFWVILMGLVLPLFLHSPVTEARSDYGQQHRQMHHQANIRRQHQLRHQARQRHQAHFRRQHHITPSSAPTPSGTFTSPTSITPSSTPTPPLSNVGTYSALISRPNSKSSGNILFWLVCG